MDKILTVNDVADILQVKAITVREMFREKRLRGFKVGKAWRTTETMLQEDVEALSRGEAPAELPSADTPTPSPVTEVKIAPAPVTKEASPPAPPAPKAKPPSPEIEEKSSKILPPDEEESDDDTQQMLF